MEKRPGETWSAALETFVASMTLDYDKWHDGIGYDLEALAALNGEERDRVEAMLIARKDEDWRDAEALAMLDSPAVKAALRECLNSSNTEVKLLVARHLKATGEADEMERVIVESLQTSSVLDGMAQALLRAEEYPTEKVKQTLFWCALHGQDDLRIHAAALLFYLYGVSKEAFDWDFRPFFLRFNTHDLAERKAAFEELCQRVRVDPEPFL